jgi:hypothetical protein
VYHDVTILFFQEHNREALPPTSEISEMPEIKIPFRSGDRLIREYFFRNGVLRQYELFFVYLFLWIFDAGITLLNTHEIVIVSGTGGGYTLPSPATY